MTGAAETFPALLARNAGERGARPAIREKRRGIWRDRSWREIADEAAALSAALAGQGVRRGEHVAFLGDNRPRLFTGMAAVHALGAVAVPLFQDAPADEIAEPLRLTRAACAFAQNQEQVDKLLSILPLCPDLRCIVFDDDRSMRHYRQPSLAAYDRLLAEGRALLRKDPGAATRAGDAVAPGDPAMVFFTAGASGRARGAMFSGAALIDRARAAASADRVGATDTTLAYLPPGWLAQTLFSYVLPLATGACVCCPESSDTVLTDLREIAPSVLVATPRLLSTLVSQTALRIEAAGGVNLALYRRAAALAERTGRAALAGRRTGAGDRLAAGLYDALIYGPVRDALGMSRMRAAYATGDALDPGLLGFFRALKVNLKQLYGATEAGYVVAAHRDGAVRADTVGHPAPGVELRVAPDGEVLVRSKGLFSGYLGDPDATAQALDADGWLRTGDLGRIEADGQLRLIERVADSGALAGGAVFHPRRVETHLKASPFVREVVAIGDGRPFAAALVDIDAARVGRWCDTQGIPYTGHADLASLDAVYGLIAGVIAAANADFAAEPELAAAQVRRFALLPKELDADDGLLTRTGKLRRGAVAERFGPLIAAIYAGAAAGPAPEGPQAAPIAIREVAVVAGATERSAA